MGGGGRKREEADTKITLTCADVEDDRSSQTCRDEQVQCRPSGQIGVAGWECVDHAVYADKERCLRKAKLSADRVVCANAAGCTCDRTRIRYSQ